MKRESLTAALVLVVLAAAPLVPALAGQAFAQTAKPKKKGAKPAASASAAPTDTAPPADTTPPAAPATSAAPETAPSASASAELPNTPPEAAASDNSNTEELKSTKYYFVGLRYRGNIVPQFLENLFVDDGATVYSNYIGVELDIRSEGHSTIPWIAYANYSFGDTLFHEKGKPDDPSNYSDVKSGLSAIYLGLDELWSSPLDEAHHWDFEYGFGVGIGVIFGTLNNDWVYLDPNGSLAGTNGQHYTQCPSTAQPPTPQPNGENPCLNSFHNNSQDTKVGNYQEKNWFSGGSVPVIFPYIAFPDIGVRWKPIKQFESRLHMGFSLTGFWFGISGSYGLEKPEGGSDTTESTKKAGGVLGARGML